MSSLDALYIVLAAFISMSVVELLKELTPLRYVFNRWAVQRWLWEGLDLRIRPSSQLWAIVRGRWLKENSIYHAKSTDTKPQRISVEWCLWPHPHAALERDVVELAACGQRAALYRPEIAQIAGQLHLLAERLMDFPAQGPIVLRAIAGVSEVRPEEARAQPDDDLKTLAKMEHGFRAALAEKERSEASASAAKSKAAAAANEGDEEPSPKVDGTPSMSAAAGELIDCRTRVTGWVQGRLNELQTTGRTAWRVVLLVLAVGTGMAVFSVANKWSWNQDTLVNGLFAGLLAPIAYEVLSMIKRVGRA